MKRLITGYDIKKILYGCYFYYRLHEHTLDQDCIEILEELHETDSSFTEILSSYDREFVVYVMSVLRNV